MALGDVLPRIDPGGPGGGAPGPAQFYSPYNPYSPPGAMPLGFGGWGRRPDQYDIEPLIGELGGLGKSSGYGPGGRGGSYPGAPLSPPTPPAPSGFQIGGPGGGGFMRGGFFGGGQTPGYAPRRRRFGDFGGRGMPAGAPRTEGGWGDFGQQAADPRMPGRFAANADGKKCYDIAGREVPCGGNPPGHYFDPSLPSGGVSGQGPEVYRGQDAATGWSGQSGANDFPLYLQGQYRDFSNAGYFDPRGNQALIEAARQNAANVSGATQRRMNLATQMYGLDPAQAATFRLQGMLGAQGGEAQAVNAALNQAVQDQARYAQSLGMAWAGQPPIPRDTSPGVEDYVLQAIMAAIGGYAGGGRR